MRCVTLNTWKNEGDYQTRLTAMADGLAALEADVIALQECFVAEPLGLDTAAILADRLGMHLTRRAMRAKPRLHQGAWVESRSDLAILSAVEPVSVVCNTVFVSADGDDERGLLRADIIIGGAPIRFGCTHLTHVSGIAGDTVRKAQVATAVQQLLDGWAEPAFLMGDFNARAGDDCLSPLFAKSEREGHFRNRGGVANLIDHILLFTQDNKIRVDSQSVAMRPNAHRPENGPSDHPAIIMDVKAYI
ncbi:MAG: endonuclease/exonuclease/phosphatase family protein [Sphingomonadaceae bacterium]